MTIIVKILTFYLLMLLGFCNTSKNGHFGSEKEIFPIRMWKNENKREITHTIRIPVGYITGSERRSGNIDYPRPGRTISGAITYAFHRLQEDQLLRPIQVNIDNRRGIGKSMYYKIGIEFELIVSETFGEEEESLRQIASLWKNRNVSVIFGPQETCLHEAKLASSLNIPLISYFCSDEKTSNKKRYPTFSRTRPPDSAIARAIVSLVLKYGWTKSIVLVYSDFKDEPRFERCAKSLSTLFQLKGVELSDIIPYREPYHHGFDENPFEPIVTRTKDTTRIYILLSEYYEHIGLVMALHRQKLLQKGEYLVIGVAMDDKQEDANPKRYFHGILSNEITKDVPSAFRSYLGIVASPPKNYTAFSKLVNEHLELAPFAWSNPVKKIGGMKRIRIEAAYLYDAVILYGTVLKEIIKEMSHEAFLTGQSSNVNWIKHKIEEFIKDGIEISKRFRKRSFRSATGLESEMDENGDATGNFTLLAVKEKNGEIGMYPIGYFIKHDELPELSLREEIQWVSGSPPVSEPICGFHDEKCEGEKIPIVIPILLTCLIVLLTSAICLVFRQWRLSRDIDRVLWKIETKDIQITNDGKRGSQGSLTPYTTVYCPVALYHGRFFAAKKIKIDSCFDGTFKSQLKMLRDIRHENLNAFIGAAEMDVGEYLVLSEYCTRGSLKDILMNTDFKLDDMFIASLVGDLARGLSYLHDSSTFKYHGNLKPSNCLVDSRWVVKLTDFTLRSPVPSIGGPIFNHGSKSAALHSKKSKDDVSSSNNYGNARHSDLRNMNLHPYASPESGNIRDNDGSTISTDSYRKEDIYSFGVILWEILKGESLISFLRLKTDAEVRAATLVPGFWSSALQALNPESRAIGLMNRCDSVTSLPSSPLVLPQPNTNSTNQKFNGKYGGSLDNLSLNVGVDPKKHAMINMSLSVTSFPSNSRGFSSAPILECLERCLRRNPQQRPNIKLLLVKLKPLQKGMGSNILDTMVAKMEKYANNLEKIVSERTKELTEEKRKTEILLYELLPSSVAAELKEGLRVPAQSFEAVSVYFSDIVSFTTLAAKSEPIQVVELLNDLYTCFDSVIDNFNVYKVETIGDAYMVASGVPNPSEGNNHALEMAKMALAVLQSVKTFKIRHRPEDVLRIRIGIHSGPICTGVVGLKRPRYCLFGDTVNVAARMESTGQPCKIHCSEAFVQLVQEKFNVEVRGLIDVKGKGNMSTYWLISEKSITKDESIGSISSANVFSDSC